MNEQERCYTCGHGFPEDYSTYVPASLSSLSVRRGIMHVRIARHSDKNRITTMLEDFLANFCPACGRPTIAIMFGENGDGKKKFEEEMEKRR